MASSRDQGQLIKWNDDRGFGFIQSPEGGKDIFLHISAIQDASRRPLVGDTVLYELVIEPDGKRRAANASIQGATLPSSDQPPPSPKPPIPPAQPRRQPKPTHRRGQSSNVLVTVISGILVAAGLVGVMTIVLKQGQVTSSSNEINNVPTSVPNALNPNCVIKGNISVDSGKKLYHVPGMEDYDITKIDLLKGERWFCTENEAVQNGWQRAPR